MKARPPVFASQPLQSTHRKSADFWKTEVGLGEVFEGGSAMGLVEYPLEKMPTSKLSKKKSTTHVRFLITCLFSQQRSAIKVNHFYYITQCLHY